jgi:hypothetical protein
VLAAVSRRIETITVIQLSICKSRGTVVKIKLSLKPSRRLKAVTALQEDNEKKQLEA